MRQLLVQFLTSSDLNAYRNRESLLVELVDKEENAEATEVIIVPEDIQ